MASTTQHHIVHRMVPLICQALMLSPNDKTVWLEGLRLLSSPKLFMAMQLTSSIWLTLLLKGLESTQPDPVVFAALDLLARVSNMIEPMKTCLSKPHCALGRDPRFSTSHQLAEVLGLLGMTAVGVDGMAIKAPPRSTRAHSTLPPIKYLVPKKHPLLTDLLSHNLPLRTRTVQQAWTQTLLSSAHENASLWLQSLFHATVEACGVPEIVITARLGSAVHADLFQTAFLKCYAQLRDDTGFKAHVDHMLASLLTEKMVSHEIARTLLELLAFLEKEKVPMPVSVLQAAKECALTGFQGDLNELVSPVVLWYAEGEIMENTCAETISNLVEVNIRMGSVGYDSAWSSLLWLRDDYNVKPYPHWITHLSHWQSALDAQNKADESQPEVTYSSFNTRLICYHALGQFQEGYELAQIHFEGLNDHERSKSAHWGTASAWHMGDYESMADWLSFHPKGMDKSLFKAIIDVHSKQYTSAFHHIQKAQSLAYDDLHTELGAGPQVAQRTLSQTELLIELQEVVQYKSQPDQQPQILQIWKNRFKRSHPDASSWLKRLQIWTLACPPTQIELQACYLDCAKLCENTGMYDAARRLLDIATPTTQSPGCPVEYTKMRFLWKNATAKHDDDTMKSILNDMHRHLDTYLAALGIERAGLEMSGLGLRPLVSSLNCSKHQRHLLARRYYRLAQWTETVQGNYWLSDPRSEVFMYHSLAYKLDDHWFNAAFALSQAAMSIFEANGYDQHDEAALNGYVVPAIRGLFRGIQSNESPEFVIRALLRLVTLWFRYGENESVLQEVASQLTTTPIHSWLLAIPQLIARLGTNHEALQNLLIDLLKNIAFNFPHAVVWPLLTACQTRKLEHQDAARVIMNHICSMPDGVRLVSQAELVGKELIRASISWMEQWRSLIDKVLPRQDLMEVAWEDIPAAWEDDIFMLQSPETPDEEQFFQQFAERIFSIHKVLLQYAGTRQVNLLNSAYTELYKIFMDLDAQLNQWRLPGTKIQLLTAAPKLLSLRDCILTVPGQYDHTVKLDDQAFIDSFNSEVDILASKQLPRKLVIKSYQSDFTFLLKGHEDMRGDERIMQLFSLVNTLLNHNTESFARNLHLLPYEVIPLSPDAGLISWVPNTQTLQVMIQTNRDKDKSHNLTNRELASLLGYDPDKFDPRHDNPKMDAGAEMDKYDKLSTEEKCERLKAALSHSDQSDLRKILWQRSPSSDVWLKRRTNFVRTLGVGSFVGHIIGLGDRHGSNILVDQLTWGALHIDFGDLFGVAQERSYLPEKVPFRLTRMMTNAFEVACSHGHSVPGSRGTFKQASIFTMSVLRDNRSTLLAMLEAFLYDPLLSWTADSHPSTSNTNVASGQENVAVMFKASRPTNVQTILQTLQPLDIPARSVHDQDVLHFPENSLFTSYLDTDSYMAKISSTGMTNMKALQVLAQIERKLAGYNAVSDKALPVKKQVQELIEAATDLNNLAQGYVLGWIPHW